MLLQIILLRHCKFLQHLYYFIFHFRPLNQCPGLILSSSTTVHFKRKCVFLPSWQLSDAVTINHVGQWMSKSKVTAVAKQANIK